MRVGAFTVDVEAEGHAELLRRHGHAGRGLDRVDRALAPLLDAMERRGARGTFFVVGEVAASHPELVHRLVEAGHEVGCHGHTHRPLWSLDPAGLRDELRAARAALALGGATDVIGFRAPTFSLDRRTGWALRVLAEEGFRYDSSIVPAAGPLYGCPGAPRRPYRPSPSDPAREDPSGPILELPAPVLRVGPLRVPVGGGIYLRALPFALYAPMLRRAVGAAPFFVYVHPWDGEPAAPPDGLPRLARWATYLGRRGFWSKVERLLASGRFVPVRTALGLDPGDCD